MSQLIIIISHFNILIIAPLESSFLNDPFGKNETICTRNKCYKYWKQF